MFDTSLLHIVTALLFNLLVPLVPWALFLWLCFGTKRKGLLFYLLSRFVGVGVVAYFLFNLQFVWSTVWRGVYLLMIALLLLWLIIKGHFSQSVMTDYLQSLSVSIDRSALFKQRWAISRLWKFLLVGILIALWWFFINSLVFTTQFPTYADDSFGNRNKPVLNILHDGGVKMFGERDEILARWRLGYPIHIALYKAQIAQMYWWYNDMTTDLLQWYAMLFGVLFVILVTRKKTTNLLLSLLPGLLIISLPLVFIHTVESYHETLSARYAILMIWAFYTFLKEKTQYGYLALWLMVGGILAYIKNDGFVVYAPGILLPFVLLLSVGGYLKDVFFQLKKQVLFFIRWFLILLRFWLPFFALKQYYDLWSNQAAGEERGLWLSSQIHREIFDRFSWLFFQMDNYGPVLIAVIFLIVSFLLPFFRQRKGWKTLVTHSESYLLISVIAIFCLFVLVFLMTENYKFVLDQTTVNRVFSMCFLILFAFSWLLLHDNYAQKS